MTSTEREFLDVAALTADRAKHPFPQMAACEAALESGYGKSLLALTYNNLFGMKQHRHAAFGTVNLPTREFVDGEWVQTSANWVSYPDWETSFADRAATLQRLASLYPHYAKALAATDPIGYVKEVSQTWSTDPARADKCIAIYRDWDVQAPDVDGEIAT